MQAVEAEALRLRYVPGSTVFTFCISSEKNSITMHETLAYAKPETCSEAGYPGPSNQKLDNDEGGRQGG